jgi:DNA-binding NarL/FixJ family response regulator
LSVVLADDSALFRSGLAALLIVAGVQVLAEVSDVPATLAAVAHYQPAVAVLDVRMPPTHTDEGICAAVEIRRRLPRQAVLVLSTYAESDWVERLLTVGADRVGYMLKDRVDDISTLVEALTRVAAGGTAIDPHVIERLVTHRSRTGALDQLTDRERDVLSLMAEGLSNAGIARRLHLAPKTVESHVAAIFMALGLSPHADANRRVRAVVTFLRTEQPPQGG